LRREADSLSYECLFAVRNGKNGKKTQNSQKIPKKPKILRFLQKKSTFFVKYIDKLVGMRYN
jgi:hypothetical protein